MSNSVYVGASNSAKNVKSIYVGVDGIARRVQNGYVGVGGVARLFYSGRVSVGYTGTFSTQDVICEGKPCTLYTLTTSGTLTISGPVRAWLCGGGGNGGRGGYSTNDSYTVFFDSGSGGGGGYFTSETVDKGEYAVVIGGAGADTKIGDNIVAKGSPSIKYQAAASSRNDGGSGGGAGWYKYSSSASIEKHVGEGQNISSVPFGISELKPHCAGGGAGNIYYGMAFEDYTYIGGNGGSDGGNGVSYAKKYVSGQKGIDASKGGEYGGGNGGTFEAPKGTNATFYGGGGGGAYGEWTVSSQKEKPTYSGGSGYQGVVYLLIPN